MRNTIQDIPNAMENHQIEKKLDITKMSIARKLVLTFGKSVMIVGSLLYPHHTLSPSPTLSQGSEWNLRLCLAPRRL